MPRHSRTTLSSIGSGLRVESGAPVSVGQAQLGHADPNITLNIYSHMIGGGQPHEVEKVAGISDYCPRRQSGDHSESCRPGFSPLLLLPHGMTASMV